ncbi:unnamed protein product [Arctia plantaginis]|uniref:Peptidase S1 domain-containing protein n=1 Tax=Arctia plantaginis TaxID=874455 RepID=A0A8S0Z8X3_ARCPL|nr:unnamed protein product [Arctia plantaginis]
MLAYCQIVNIYFHRDPLNITFIFAKCFCILLCLFTCFSKTVSLNDIQNVHTPRVINGWPAQLGDAPYQVAFKSLVKYNETHRSRRLYGTFCGAVIVAPKKLITAAHCVQSKKDIKSQFLKPSGYIGKNKLRGIYAVAGNLKNHDVVSVIDSKTNGQWRLLCNAYYPRRYLFPMHDIAVAMTRKCFYLNEYVAPIPIASTNVEYAGPCLVSGFGRLSKGYKTSYLILAYMDIMPTSSCNKAHNRNMNLFVCTDTKVSDVAQGDSGGPLVCTNTGDPEEGDKGLLVGIVSGHRPYAAMPDAMRDHGLIYLACAVMCLDRKKSKKIIIMIREESSSI